MASGSPESKIETSELKEEPLDKSTEPGKFETPKPPRTEKGSHPEAGYSPSPMAGKQLLKLDEDYVSETIDSVKNFNSKGIVSSSLFLHEEMA